MHWPTKTSETRTAAGIDTVIANEVSATGSENETVIVTVTETVIGIGEMMSERTGIPTEPCRRLGVSLLQCLRTGRFQLDPTLGITGTARVKMDWARDDDPPMMM